MFRASLRTNVRANVRRNRVIAGTLAGLCVAGGALAATAAHSTPAHATSAVRPAADVPKAAPASLPYATPASGGLHAWIDEALTVMARHHIPGSYADIKRNIMRESSGNRDAINETDSNAAAGTPSKGLLQVIAPTFNAYHVAGTSKNPYDPVANIVAACNYAAHRYGSINNVHGPY
ncbi:transglycosylase SLT domain-containing protein [Streptomyces sp. NPDC059104]|uniref:transglycosylase SLT domain-containing protein n=1 Tax=Streptomyces sp. NPDC059104 TaxID=3346729 RepID=UPI0036CC30D6